MTDPPGWSIIPGDARLIMSRGRPDRYDAIITDPPFGTASPTKVQTRSGDAASFDIEWDREPVSGWVREAARILKPGGSLIAFGDTKRVTELWEEVEAEGLKPLQLFYWIKSNPPPQPRKNFQSGVEVAVFARKPGEVVHWGGGGATPNFLKTPIAAGNDRTEHPTQKNLGLMRHLVKLVVPPGGMVLDPFCGSGTSLVAALLEGRSAVGFDISETYCAIARERINKWERSNEVRQMSLFA
jgi:site-specific DNA-methyltransferase (adenine-specific)